MQTLDQQVAKASHVAIKKYFNSNGKGVSSEKRGYIKSAATMLRVSGLGVTVAFCLKKDRKEVAEALADTLKNLPGIKNGNTTITNAESILVYYQNIGIAELRHISSLAEQSFEWLSKWADTYKEDIKDA